MRRTEHSRLAADACEARNAARAAAELSSVARWEDGRAAVVAITERPTFLRSRWEEAEAEAELSEGDPAGPAPASRDPEAKTLLRLGAATDDALSTRVDREIDAMAMVVYPKTGGGGGVASG